MRDDPTSTTNAHTDAWKNPASLGFSTWQRHTAVSLAKGGENNSGTHGAQRGKGGFRAIYERHASFAADLITRRHPQSLSAVDSGRLVYASPVNKLQRYSYSAIPTVPTTPTVPTVPPVPHIPVALPQPPSLQRQPYHGPYHGQYRSFAASPIAVPVGGHVGSATVSPADDGTSRMISRLPEPASAHVPSPAGDNSPVHGSLPSSSSESSSISSQAHAGAEARPLVAADHADSRKNSLVLSSSSISLSIDSSASSIPRVQSGVGLPVSYRSNPMLKTSPLINRSLMAPGIIYSPMRSEERIHRIYKRAGIMLDSNTKAVPALDPGVPRPVHDLSQGHVQRRADDSRLPPSGRQTLPVIPLVTESASIARTIAHAAAEPSRPGISAGADVSAFEGDNKGSNERFNEARIRHADAPGSISNVVRRATDVSSQALPLIRAEGQRTGGSGLTGREDSIALTHSAQIPISVPDSSEAIRKTPDFTLRRSRAVSSLATPAEDRPGIVSDSTQDASAHAGEHAQNRLRGYAGYGESKADSLPALQRLQDKTGPFAAHHRATMAQPFVLSIPSVHLPAERMAQLSRLSERVLQKELVSLLTPGAEPDTNSSPRIQLSHVPADLVSSRDSLRLFPIWHRPMERSEERTGGVKKGIAAGDHAAMPGAPHVSRHFEPSVRRSISGWSILSSRTNDRINFPGPAMAHHSVSIIAADNRSNTLSPAFLPLTRQTGITRSTDARLGVDPIGASSFDSNSTTPSMARGSYDHVNGPSSLKSLALPRAIHPIHPIHAVMRRAIARSTEQQSLGISDGRGMVAPQAHARNGRSFSMDQPISQVQSSWTAGSDGRPLVIPRHGLDKLMRASSQGGDALPTPDRPEDRYGLVSPSHEPMGEQIRRAGERIGERIGEVSKTPESTLAEPDPEETAEHVWRIMAERLVIEQERRGLAKWP